jgi:hypothetical protein
MTALGSSWWLGALLGLAAMALGMILAIKLQLALTNPDFYPSPDCLEAMRSLGPVIGENPCAPRADLKITVISGIITGAFGVWASWMIFHKSH